ncbi:fibropellin-1-like [Strongylocentrotus purpuratus]|uniref:EGF-like domain-containing protein n=1 Tax=Strongylocentrotus purpuratus TaxID=7668 RepID=A0A7M7P1S5_STRPU|nr:fibropellin-1-like [Strongylocentrotus purpuratus]
MCETNIDDCSTNPCMNSGVCVDEVNSFTCNCAAGYTGDTCLTDIDDCTPNLCMNGGACTDGVNSYTCACLLGFTGSMCETDIDDCSPNPCMNGGSCTDGVNTFTCVCADGFNGDTCATTVCGSAVCENNGECISDGQCRCVTGFTGTMCETNIDDCSTTPCMNGGVCVDEVNSFTCNCAAGYTGDTCQTDIDDCTPNPCMNGGACTDGVNSYTCACVAGFTGNMCETDINDCSPNPCMNGGSCTDGVNTFTCTCASGFSGDTCTTADCGSVVCQNSGTCVSSGLCDCVTGFTGTMCEININDCSPNPCTNGGSCTDGVDSFICACVAGFTGDMCETDVNECELSSSLCSDGRCVNVDGSYTCVCNAGFMLENENSCTALSSSLSTSQVTVQITGQSLNGEPLTYTSELTDRTSAKFIEYEVAFCYIFSQYVREQLGSQLVGDNCIVLSLSEGSVVGDLQMELAADSQSVADGLAVSVSALSTNIDQMLSANGQTLLVSSILSEASQGLSNGAIIGIALGVFGFVLVLITCVCCVFVQGVRQNQATKLMLAEQRYENPSRQNRGFYGNESFNGSDEYNSLEGRRYAVGQALDRLRGTDSQRHEDRNFRTPYVVDGSETYNDVERNPMHY